MRRRRDRSSSPTSATRGCESVLDRLARLARRRSSPTPSSTQAPQRLGSYARAIGERFATARGPRDGAPRPDHRQRSGVHDGRAPRPRRRWPGPSRRALPTAGRHNAANALAVAGAATALGVAPGRGRGRARHVSRASAGASNARARSPVSSSTTTTAITRRRSARRWRRSASASPAGRVWAVYEPLTFHRTAAMLGAFADVLSAADAVAIADIWAGRDPDTTVASARRPGVRGRRAPAGPDGPRAGIGRGDRRPARRDASGRATSCWSWAAARAIASVTGYCDDWRHADDRLRGSGGVAGRVRPGAGRRSAVTPGSGCSPTMPSTMRTRSARRSSATTPCGHTCWTPRRPNATSSSRWSGTGSRARPCSRPGTRRSSGTPGGQHARLAGFLTAEIAADGRASRFREWTVRAPATAG